MTDEDRVARWDLAHYAGLETATLRDLAYGAVLAAQGLALPSEGDG